MKLITAVVAGFATCAAILAAQAATFDLTYTGADFSLSATLDAADLGGGDWLITDLSGTVFDGSSEPVSLIPGGPGAFLTPSGSFIVDNVLYYPSGSGQYFDIDGLAFTASGAEWNLWGNGSSYTLGTCQGGCYTFDYGTVAVSQVPEISTWAMMALGFACLGLAGYKTTHRRAETAI
jgi:hypothetical protein